MSTAAPDKMNVNQEGFDRRMDAVRDIVRGLGLEGIDITPVEYVEHCPFPYNNYIYKVALSSPASAASFRRAAQQPCTVSLPAEGVSAVVVRLSNPDAEGMNNTNRVENEVAAMHLAREAVARLGAEYAGLVPALYAWKAAGSPSEGGIGSASSSSSTSAEAAFGWTIMEYVSGAPLDGHFKTFSKDDKKRVVGDIARVFSAIQAAELPSGVDSFGGLTIDAGGAIVSAQPTLLQGGPWPTYAGFCAAKLRSHLKDADEHERIQGWRPNGVRDRIERFIDEKLQTVLEGGVDVNQKSLIHSDFTLNNFMWDPETKRITALLDFDWSAISHPAEEFTTSLHDLGGTTLRQPSDALKHAILTGDFSRSADQQEEEVEEAHREAWEKAQTWDAALRQHGGTRLADIRGMETLERLRALNDLVCPFEIGYDMVPREKTPEERAEMRVKKEKALVAALESFGV